MPSGTACAALRIPLEPYEMTLEPYEVTLAPLW